jgi:transmembrane sensor
MTSRADNIAGGEVPSAATCAEAAAWIARLHGEERTVWVEEGFGRWLAASPTHRLAFEMANDIWTSTEKRPKPVARVFVRKELEGQFFALTRMRLAAAALALIAAGGAVLYSRDPGLATGVGEQRTLTLEDGTRITMNTATRIHVHYDHVARRIELDKGETLFEVAKRPTWPFIVTAGAAEVRALGTQFLVRRDDEKLAVTLIEGKVAVTPATPAAEIPQAEAVSSGPARLPMHRSAVRVPTGAAPKENSGLPVQAQVDAFTLYPGERLTFVNREVPTLDRPPLDKVIAWERGHAIFDHTPLADAVREMNRYSDVEIRIEDAGTARAQVTGIFRTGESENFARSVAETYQLQLVAEPGRLLLIGSPRKIHP